MSELVPVDSLVLDEELYPRAKVNLIHVQELMRALAGGHELPAVVCCDTTRRIVDGAHRHEAHKRRQLSLIPVIWKHYDSDEDFFRDAVLLNTGHGLNLTTYDRLKVLEIGAQFGLKEVDFATLLRTSTSYVRTIMPRHANVTTARSNGTDVTVPIRRVPLKRSVAHLTGRSITPEQADAIEGNTPGTSYLLLVRQLINALQHDLLPEEEIHPALWVDMQELAKLLNDAVSVTT